jgi:integrase
MPTASLTLKTIEKLQAKLGQQFVVWDTELTGFGVRVSPGGTKTFVFAYRTPGRRKRWKTLGRVGRVALEEARRLARVDTGIVAARQDPLQQTDAARGAFTVRQVAKLWMVSVRARRKPRTADSYQQVLDTHILPRLGRMPMVEITQADAIRLHEALRKTPVQANRVIRTLSSLLTWSMRGNGRYRPLGHNPCFGIELYPETKRTRYLTDTEYARVGKALRTSTLAPAIRAAIELLLLTGARPIEIASLKWAFVDQKSRALRLPESKTGPKTIYLSPAAWTVLKRWPLHAHSPYVFPGTGRKQRGEHLHPSTLTHAWADLRETLDLKDVRLYDARHSYASVGVSEYGLSLPQVGKQLGHSQPSTTQRYAHLHETVAQEHANQIGSSIAAALKKRVR